MRGTDEQSMNMMYPCDVISFMIDNAEAFIKIVRSIGIFRFTKAPVLTQNQAGGGAAIVETGGVEEAAEEEPEEDGEPVESDSYSASGTAAGSQKSEIRKYTGEPLPAAAGGFGLAPSIPPPLPPPPPPPPEEEL